MRTSGLVHMSLTAAAILFGGCASTSARNEPASGTTAAPGHDPGMGMMQSMCPMQVPNTTVTATDVAGGVVIAFATIRTSDVAELRRRVRGMAEMHNHHHDAGSGDKAAGGGMMEGGDMKMGEGMLMPAASATVEDVEGGARLVLRPKDQAQLEALRKHARMHAKRMASGKCPMMSPSAQEQATAPAAAGNDHEAHH